MNSAIQEPERWKQFLNAKNKQELSIHFRHIINEFKLEPDVFFIYLSAQTGKKNESLNNYLATLTTQQVKDKLNGRIPTIPAITALTGTICSIIGFLDKELRDEEDLLAITHDSIKWAKQNGACDMSRFYMLLLSDDRFINNFERYLSSHKLLTPRN